MPPNTGSVDWLPDPRVQVHGINNVHRVVVARRNVTQGTTDLGERMPKVLTAMHRDQQEAFVPRHLGQWTGLQRTWQAHHSL